MIHENQKGGENAVEPIKTKANDLNTNKNNLRREMK